jgi:hypothetical protein
MATHNMFLAMILTNAKRAEARAVLLTVDKMQPRIDMLLLDGSSQPISAPPPDILLKIIESLDKGQTEYQSSVYSATVEEVTVSRGPDGVQAHVAVWKIDHT